MFKQPSILLLASTIALSSLSACNGFRQEKVQVSSGEQLAAHTKPSVVRIADGCQGKVYWQGNHKTYEVDNIALGSGYFVNANGYIVTNAHVTENSRDEDNCKSELWKSFIYQLAKDYDKDPAAILRDAEAMQKIAQNAQTSDYETIRLVFLPTGDKLPFETKIAGKPVGEGKDVAVIKVEVKNAPVLKLGDSEQVQLQDHLTVAGFPGAGDSGVLNRKSAFVVSFTDGKLSAKKTTEDGAPVLQVSAPATHGNSGGPVLDDRGNVIGMLTFGGDRVNGQEVSGFAFAIPSSTIQEFIKQAGIENEPTAVDRYYQEGLELFWKKKYTDAIAKFEAVKQLFPQHSEADALIQKSRQEIAMVQK